MGDSESSAPSGFQPIDYGMPAVDYSIGATDPQRDEQEQQRRKQAAQEMDRKNRERIAESMAATQRVMSQIEATNNQYLNQPDYSR